MCVFMNATGLWTLYYLMCFIMNHAKCLRRIKWEFVHTFMFQGRAMSWEEGWLFWSDNGISSFMTFYLLPNCSEHSENWKKGEKQQQPLPYSGKWQQKLVAWNFCPWTTKLQIVGLIITRKQFRPSFDHSLRYLVCLLKEPAKVLWKK